MSLNSYGPQGPLGFPLTEKQTRNLDTLLKALPKSKEFECQKTVFLKAPTELNPGERSDVSWISTETPPRFRLGRTDPGRGPWRRAALQAWRKRRRCVPQLGPSLR